MLLRTIGGKKSFVSLIKEEKIYLARFVLEALFHVIMDLQG